MLVEVKLFTGVSVHGVKKICGGARKSREKDRKVV